MGGGVENLRARHRDLHRPAQHARADRSERCVDVVRQFVAEAAADIAGDDAHVLGRNVERSRETFAGAAAKADSKSPTALSGAAPPSIIPGVSACGAAARRSYSAGSAA